MKTLTVKEVREILLDLNDRHSAILEKEEKLALEYAAALLFDKIIPDLEPKYEEHGWLTDNIYRTFSIY